MSNKDFLKDLGFETYLQLYEFLKKHGHETQEFVQLIPVARLPADFKENAEPKPREQVQVNVPGVMALAFAEIFPALPSANAMDVIRELVLDSGNSGMSSQAQSIFINFLKKIPTRS